jgi:hypothetical protein
MKILELSQGSDIWHEHRWACVTGTRIESAVGASYSNATGAWTLGGKTWIMDGDKLIVDESKKVKSIDRKKQNTLLLELVSERQSELEINDFCSADMERGNDLEPHSGKAAEERHVIKLVPCGMLQSDTMPRFKYSPDFVCFDKNGVIVGGYETKSKAGKKHIEYLIDNQVPSEHLLQCLCPMIMDDCVKWWIFGHFDDRNQVNNLFTKGIKRENYEDFINEARSLLVAFLAEVDLTVEKMGGEYHG